MKPNSNEDPSLESLARELGSSFRPLPPGDDLKDRIRRLAEAEQVKRHSSRLPAVWQWFVASPLHWAAAAAVLILVVALGLTPVSRKSEAVAVSADPALETTDAVAETVEEETLWGQGEVAGIVDSGDGRPMWKLRYETVRRIAWSDEQGGTQLLFEPEERLIFVPVSYN